MGTKEHQNKDYTKLIDTWTAGTILSGLRQRRITNLEDNKMCLDVGNLTDYMQEIVDN